MKAGGRQHKDGVGDDSQETNTTKKRSGKATSDLRVLSVLRSILDESWRIEGQK